jgi:tRNA1Val (adenine37-N6)-methyltransferase
MIERIDDLGDGFGLIQNPSRFCFGTDAVLLAAFCNVKRKDRVLDLGTGNGILPVLICMGNAGKGVTVRGLEIQREDVELARRNVELNGLEGSVEIDEGDIKNVKNIYKHGGFNAVVSNPPYYRRGDSIERSETLCTLNDVITAAAWALKFGGRFYMIHRTERLCDVVCGCREHGVEVKKVLFKSDLMLVYAKKGAASGVTVSHG